MDEGQILALRHPFAATLTGGGQPVLQSVAVTDQGGLGGHRETAVRMIVAVLVSLPRIVDQPGKDHNRQRIVETEYTRMIVCRDGLDHILGVLQTGDLLRRVMPGHAVTTQDIEAVLSPPLYIPESVTTAQLLEHFRNARLQFALIVDEYGEVEGMVTMTDVLAAIVGDISSPATAEDRDMIQREDGSWLVDGDVSLERIKSVLDIDEELPGETSQTFHTLGGLVMHMLGRIPAPSDYTEAAGWRIEVVDMDRNRVDKVLMTKLPEPSEMETE
jgi:putative hemolysin